MFKIPLGWMQLKKEKLRFAVALLGVSFAAVLILMQLGFREAMFESAVRYHQLFKYDVALLSPRTSFIANSEAFSQRRLFQALAVEGVESVSPIYLGLGAWKNPWTGLVRRIFVVGFRPADDPLAVPEISRRLATLQLRDAVLYDEAARPEFGPVVERLRAGERVEAELNNHAVQVHDTFLLGTSFGIDGSVITSDVNFLRLFPNRPSGLIDLGLVRIAPGTDPERVAADLRALLPEDVDVYTREEYIAYEKRYWDVTTPIGYVFTFGTIVGLVVGGIIVYQILFADVSDHLAEYATLKAMGYSNAYLSSVVMQQAVILAVLGYVPGVAICMLLYRLAGEATRLPLHLTPERGLAVLGLTIAMCCVAALMALRKVRSLDPADVF